MSNLTTFSKNKAIQSELKWILIDVSLLTHELIAYLQVYFSLLQH